MEALGAFATLVGLICNFKSESRAISDNEYKEFSKWLDKHRHTKIIEELNINHLLSLNVKSLLNQSHEVVVKKLKSLDFSITQLASQIDGLKDIAKVISPTAELSNQALKIIKAMNTSSSYILAEVPCIGKTRYGLSNDNEYRIFLTRIGPDFPQSDLQWLNISEEMYFHDDLISLVKLGLISEKMENYGGRSFRITRLSKSYLANLN